METLFKDPGGPIEEFSWGKYVIRGEVHEKNNGKKQGKGKDIYLVDGKAKIWKEREGHTLEPRMVSRVFDKDINTLIIGLGVYGRINCTEETKKEIRKNGIDELILLKTPEACKIYNEYYHQGKKVALLAHGTC
ncbi:MAG TPA: MTH938/NDUFAF3 family protein [Bacteroidales bacterium]|nr:MTH938/NDUFAF3 family protein [Bacteroidales bacterium]